ncbi:VOC family protein [Nocardioides terrisoli]|uniref:VOC family protein n=1 Tax=Nocardioides terrisoli TaxID=3388267 RepID=UPI00287B5F6F|nr:VOC family protein [Nocardioides marmorisolisilvae]
MDYPLTPDSVELDELGGLLDRPPRLVGHLHPERGEILFELEDDPLELDDELEDEWIPIEGEGPRAAYADMADFADAVGDPALARELSHALDAKGPFREFRRRMQDADDETGRLWHEFSHARASLRALEWLLDRDLVDPAQARETERALEEVCDDSLEAVATVPVSADAGSSAASVSVRYIVDDVDAAIAFYCTHLGFVEVMHPAPTFAMLQRGALRLVLSAPGGGPGGGQAMPDGSLPRPGGWNRFSLEVDDLDETVAGLRRSGATFRNEIVDGVGGRQVLVDDPAGNPVELFQPTIAEAWLGGSGVRSGS